MSHQQTVPGEAVIDSREFALGGGHLEGEIAVSRLERLRDLLAGSGGSLKVELTGGRDGEGHPCLKLKVSGSLELLCQRCLGGLEWPVAIDSELRLVDDAEAPAAEDEEFGAEGPDAITAERELAVAQLVEDEVLLSLPIAPRHDRCATPLGDGKDRAPSPFAVLAQLKKH